MKRIYTVFVLLMIAAVALAGCSSAPQYLDNRLDGEGLRQDVAADKPAYAGDAMPNPEPVYEAAETPQESAAPEEEWEGVSDSEVMGGEGASYIKDSMLQPSVNRKVIYSGTIEANTKEFKKDCDMIKSRLLDIGGYVESSYIEGTEPKDWQDSGRLAQMTLRVPNKRFDEFIQMLEGVGQNLNSSVNGEDISLQYFDRETKLKTLRNRQSRLEEMLKDPAYKLEAIIELEREHADVSYEIQMLETEIRTYDSLVDFSTVRVTLHEVMEIKAVTTPEEQDLGTRISNGFYSVLNSLADFGEDLIVFFASAAIIIVPIAAIVIIVIILAKRSGKRRAKAMAAAQANYYERENKQ